MFVKVNKEGSECSCFKEGEVVEKVGTDVFRRIHELLPEQTGVEQFLIKGLYTVITEHSVGDKLVALRDRPHNSEIRENDVVEFVDVALDGCLRVKDKDSETWYVLDSHVKACTAEVNTLVTEEIEYKIGDKVVITDGTFYATAYKKGSVATVVAGKDPDGDYSIHIDGENWVYVGANQIKPYVEPQLDMFSKAFEAHTEPSTVKVDTNYQVNLNLTTEQLRDLRDCLGKFGNRINVEHPVANDVFMELKRHLTLIGSNS